MFVEVATVIGFVLVLARTSAMVLVAPVFSTGPGFQGYKLAVVVSISAVMFLALGQPLPTATDPLTVGLLLLREVFLGLFLGFLLHVVTLVVRVGGELIGHEMGFMVARQVDPATGIQTTLITSFYENVFLLALLALNGHHWLLRGLGDSFGRAPVGRLELSGGVVDAVTRLFTQMFGAGIVFAAPVMIFLTLTSILIGLLARAVPHLNILEIGFTLRVAVALCAIALFAPLLEPALTGLNTLFVEWLHHGLDALEA